MTTLANMDKALQYLCNSSYRMKTQQLLYYSLYILPSYFKKDTNRVFNRHRRSENYPLTARNYMAIVR